MNASPGGSTFPSCPVNDKHSQLSILIEPFLSSIELSLDRETVLASFDEDAQIGTRQGELLQH